MTERKNNSEHQPYLQEELLRDIRIGRYSKDMTLFNVNHMALIHVLSSRMNVMTNITTSCEIINFLVERRGKLSSTFPVQYTKLAVVIFL